MRIRAKKDLINDTGQKDFTKGKIYDSLGNTSSMTENMEVINDNNEVHRLGNWLKHFTPVK